MINRSLFAVVVFLWSFGASAQLFNPIVAPPFSGVFGNPGTPPTPFFNQTAAVNYNYGGQRVGYNVPSPGCVGITCVAGASTYRADAINFKTSTFGTGFNFQLGFSTSPNSWNYTIAISQPGPYVITLWAGSASAGGSWNILIDDTLVGNVPTPNTGSYATLAASTSGVLSPTPTQGSHTLTLAWASGDAAGGSGDLVAWQGALASVSGGVPAPASAAGFTTQVLHADFSQPAYTDTTTWVDGCGGPTSGNRWVYRFLASSAGGAPCSYLKMETDSTIGKQVLHLSTPASDSNGYDINWPAIPFLPAGDYFAPEMYMEVVFRMAPGSLTQTTTSSPWGGELGVSSGLPNWLEPDFFEVITNPSASSWVYGDGTLEWISDAIHGGIFASPPNSLATDESIYHTYGILFTSDGTTNFWKCAYFDGVDEGCAGFNLTDPNSLKFHGFILNMIFGTNGGPNGMDIYIQRFDIWACPGSFGTSVLCAGTVITQ